MYKRLAAAVTLTGGALAYSAVAVVPQGHVGILDLMGECEPELYRPGMHVKNPLARLVTFSTRTQLLETNVKTPTREGLDVGLDLAVNFRVSPDAVQALYRDVGRDYRNVLLKPLVKSTIRSVTSQFDAKSLYTSERVQLTELLHDELRRALSPRGIIVERTPLKGVELPSRLREAIEEKLSYEQESARMEFVLERERQEAQRKELEAIGIQKFQRIVSKGISPGLLQWKGIEATERLSLSDNTKVLVMGTPFIGGRGSK